MRNHVVLCMAVLGLASCAMEVGSEPGVLNEDEEDSTVSESGDEDAVTFTPTGTSTAYAVTAGCTATAELAGHPAWFFFTRPDRPCEGDAGSGVDHHAINELIRLIETVPSGGRIDGHIFNITVNAVGKALYQAQERGITVRISTDGQVGGSSDDVKSRYLDKLKGIVYCDGGATHSCVSNHDGGISHTKLFVFSHATAPDAQQSDNVVWFGSANQTRASGMSLYNNTVTIYGDAPLYDKMRGYLDDLQQRRRADDYYDPTSGRGHLLAASADIYVSPEATTDLVVNRLDDITPDASCSIKVMQASVRDSRLAVVQRLVTMKQGGCSIEVVAATVEPAALAALKAAGISVRRMPIHDKSFVVYGKYETGYQYRVYTGSHNLSGGALRRNDEILVKLAAETDASHRVYDAYMAHFNDAFGVGTPL